MIWLLIAWQMPTLPSPSTPQITVWEDLDGDGQTEIWVRNGDDEYWVWDPGQSHFQKVGEIPHLRGRVTYREENYFAEGLLHNAVLFQRGAEHKIVPFPDTIFGREKARANYSSLGSILPTQQGQVLYTGGCWKELPLRPHLQLNSKTLRVRYPNVKVQDFNGDGLEDIAGFPLTNDSGQVTFFLALNTGNGFEEKQGKSNIPMGYKVQDFNFGDLDKNGELDIVLLLMPNKNFSLFDELSLTYYLAEENGWSLHAPQLMKTKQNLWQTGPIIITDKGVELMYFKGLIKGKFRCDQYRFEEAFFDPKINSTGWSLKEANRDFILPNIDINQDGAMDVALQDEDGLKVFIRSNSDAEPYNEDRFIRLSRKSHFGFEFVANIGETMSFEIDSGRRPLNLKKLIGTRGLVLQDKELWSWKNLEGSWQLERREINN